LQKLFFINDIIDDISIDSAGGIVTLNDYLIYLILFADDTVYAKINVRINNLKFHIVIKEMIIYRPPAISKNNYFGFVNVNFNIPFLAIYE
jgi:hypothetical protein